MTKPSLPPATNAKRLRKGANGSREWVVLARCAIATQPAMSALTGPTRRARRRRQQSPVSGENTKDPVKTIAQGMSVEAAYLW